MLVPNFRYGERAAGNWRAVSRLDARHASSQAPVSAAALSSKGHGYTERHLSRSPLTIENPARQSSYDNPFLGRTVALVIAHPGHELRVHRLLELTRPRVFVLTDGSGRTGHSRLTSTSAILTSAHVHPASIYGRFTDVELYELMLRGDAAAVVALMWELVAAFRRDGVDGVVGDALEGFNPSHDLCRFLINAVVLLLRKETGRDMLNFAFPLDASPEQTGA